MLTTGEVAKLFQVSAQTVINWLDQGRMPFERIGRGPRRLTEETVLKYIREIGISPSALDQTIFTKTMKKIVSGNDGDDDSVAVINANMMVIGWNEGARLLTGLEAIDVLGKPVPNLIQKVKEANNDIDLILKNEWSSPSLDLEVSHTSKNGKSVNLSMTASRFYSRGDVAGYTLVYRKK
jgi:excisionase family DNA binding protein/PAS domain S-box-containing protein